MITLDDYREVVGDEKIDEIIREAKPLRGKYVVHICAGTACHVSGAKAIIGTIEDELEIEVGDTSEDGLFTFLTVACIGCCSLAPVIMVNDDTHGRLTPASLRKILKGYRRKGKQIAEGAVGAS